MNEKRVRGDIGEDAVCRYLRRRLYRIADRNYSCRFGEIDIIAVRKDKLCFVEVKTRSPGSLSRPAAAVDEIKQRRLILTAQHYCMANPSELQPRFDVAEVYLEGDRVRKIVYIDDAFIIN